MFKKPFSFRGIIKRREFIISLVIGLMYSYIVGIIIGVAELHNDYLNIALLPAYWFIFAQGTKRCHDRGNSGFFQLIPFYYLWMIFAGSISNNNEYVEKESKRK